MRAGCPQGFDHAFCPRCGYELLPGAPGAAVRCSECGELLACEELSPTPPPSGLAKTLLKTAAAARFLFLASVLLALVLFVFGGVFSHTRCRCGGPWRTAAQLNQIHKGFLIYADDTGAYPVHGASLVPANMFPPELLVGAWVPSASDSLMVGEVDLLKYDWTPDQSARLNQAIGALDVSGQYYRLGDFWFARLPKPTMNGDIIFGWTAPDYQRLRWVVRDDNQVERLDSAGWNKAWRAHAKARRQLGLPPLGAPP